jgi:hypothetical protein
MGHYYLDKADLRKLLLNFMKSFTEQDTSMSLEDLVDLFSNNYTVYKGQHKYTVFYPIELRTIEERYYNVHAEYDEIRDEYVGECPDFTMVAEYVKDSIESHIQDTLDDYVDEAITDY